MSSVSPVSLREIARAAGVSAMSVSRALRRDYKYISRAEARRIRKLAVAMGYALNPYLSSWMRNVRQRRPVQGSEVIAVIFRGRDDANYSQLFLNGGNRFAATIGYRMDTFLLDDYPDAGALLRTLRSRGIRGVILSLPEEASLPREILQHSIVWAHTPPEGQPGDFIEHDYFEAMTLALEKLAEYGYRRIGYWSVERIEPHRRWEAAYLYYRSNIPVKDQLPVLRKYRSVPRAEKVRWIETHRPEVIICPDYTMSFLPEATQLPEPVHMPWVSLGVQPDSNVAGIDQQLEAHGVAAVRMVTRKMELNEVGVPEQPRGTIVGPTWHDGATAPRKVSRD